VYTTRPTSSAGPADMCDYQITPNVINVNKLLIRSNWI
jgi:hypothetical protein